MNPFHYRQGALSLDFYSTDELGALNRRRVRLSAITGFGIEYEPVFAPSGTFTRWQPWGYLRAGKRIYRVSPRLIRAWQRAWRWALIAKRERIGIRSEGAGQVHRVHEWDYSVVSFKRRGSVQPRRWDGQPAPPTTQTPTILNK
jgi:hypothetical protein